MRTSQYLLATEKETPNDAELISHQLMIRAGMIRKVAAGIYNWMPLGLKALQKVEQIVREEMNRSHAIEILMPHLIPAELWQETGRWQQYGPELLRITDRHKREYCFGPTHEEVVTEIARKEIKSYKQLPLNLYQIQMKFRDEIRPRFGVMRGREFVMKDAYSFHTSRECLQKTYDVMYETYSRIFRRLGLKFRAVEADTGAIGGSYSHEFQVLAEAGEDLIFYSDSSDYAANIEQASAKAPEGARPSAKETMKLIDTPGQRSIEDLAKNYNLPPHQSVKTMIGKNAKGELFAFIVRGDHTLNEVKAKKQPGMMDHFELASEAEIRAKFNAGPGSLGPVNCPVKIIVDRDAAHLADFACGANIDDKHYVNVNWDRDVKDYVSSDIRNVVVGDISPDGKGKLLSARGIEVGHIFQLGDKYSKAMNCTVLDENGKPLILQMGCYGIGVSRILGAAIEQNHDEKGIVWPLEMAPFQVALVALRYKDSEIVRTAADQLYQDLLEAGVEVIFDDRNERPGVMFADMELIGIPHRIVISERGLSQGKMEYKARTATEAEEINAKDALHFILAKIK